MVKNGSAQYHREIQRLARFLIPPGSNVLELGCGDGDLLAAVQPSKGLGIDISEEAIRQAQERHTVRPELTFRVADAETVDWTGEEPFDYIIIADLIPLLKDIQRTMSSLKNVCTSRTRVIVLFHSNLWRPWLSLASLLGLRRRVADYNWLALEDVRNLLYLSDFEPVVSDGRVLMPIYVPLLSSFLNRFVAKLPFIRFSCLSWYVVARLQPQGKQESAPASVSIVVPTRNERGNIEDVFARTTPLGSWTELVFVDGRSDDGTIDEIRRCTEKYKDKWPRVALIHQTGKGKGQAVRQAFDQCSADMLMILDSDLTMPPEELPKYYQVLVSGKGEFVNGCRLVYPPREKAMRFLNMIANHGFALLFSWLLGQRVKDTLCGTKVFWSEDYRRIAENRSYFGDFDPFGDFDLLFGASKLNLKIVDLPIRYRERTYGEIKIDRWRDGALLVRMSAIAFKRLKLLS